MDPVEQISYHVHIRVEELGTEIIRFTEEKQSISECPEFSEADRLHRIGEARDSLRQKMETVFGESGESISSDIRHIVESCDRQTIAGERGLTAGEVWRQELPGLRLFLEYCTEMIAAHPEQTSPRLRKSQKCLTEASCVLEKISARIDIAISEK